MAKFTSKKDMKLSLFGGLNLVVKEDDPDDWHWCAYEELSSDYAEGYRLVNEEKRTYYERSMTRQGG